MRNSRPPIPPSTLSGSSGHGLVYGAHKPRGQQLAFTPESSEQVPTKKKTRLIVILGIALPALACVIGIAAWAVTTDVLRITPRANDNNYNRFGHQGKTRIDSMQARSDQDVDVFVLHGITTPTSPSPTSSTKKMTSSTTTSTTGSSISTGQTVTSSKASDILSKLISEMPPPKNSKNFVVFAPIPDVENNENQRKGRRLDSKLVHRDGDDLVAEESIISEDTSQELGLEKTLFNRKRKPTVAYHSLKPEQRPGHRKINPKEKFTKNPRILHGQASERPPNFIKRPQRGEFVAFPPNPKPSVNSISNRNGGAIIPNIHFPRNNSPNPQQNNMPKKNTVIDQQQFRNPPQSFENVQPMSSSQTYQPPGFKKPIPHSLNNKENLPQFQMMGSSAIQNKESNIQSNQFPKDNNRSPPFQKQQNTESSQNQYPPMQVSHPPNYSNSPQNAYSPESSLMGSGGPQYFSPPLQTFHTKMNYDQPSSKFPSSPSAMSSYEKAAQVSVDPPQTDGAHHHHHHHHHHEPVASNSDPIGDVNFSDVPRNTDADRLGSIGIGLGTPRGITLQIGGGGLGGLLPLGTLGIARNIVHALLPRPQLGLNSKVFMGIEVGRGGGLSIG